MKRKTMPSQYVWTPEEKAALDARIDSLEQSRDFLAATGFFNFVAIDDAYNPNPTPIPADGGTVHLVSQGAVGHEWHYPLAAPVNDIVVLEIINKSWRKQVIDAPGLLWDGVSDLPLDKITLDGHPGASIRLRGYDGRWHPVGAPNHAAIS
jgi:hypothetical protein